VVIATSASASASDPLSIVTSPRAVQWIPDKATATEFVIHGTFELNKGGTPPSYTFTSPPSCGYLHFKCPAGSESLCRMQWGEIESVIGSGHCRAFGTLSAAPSVTVHPEGTPLGTADSYDLGTGTQDVYGLGECSSQVAMKCDATTTDAGPSDTGAADTGTTPTDTGTTATDTGTAATDTGTPAADSGAPKVDSGSSGTDAGTTPDGGGGDSGGCSYGSAPASIGLGALSLLALGLVGRRRSRSSAK
jgi:hypothetical protein